MKNQQIRSLLALLVAGLGGAWIVTQGGARSAVPNATALSIEALNSASTEIERMRALVALVAAWRQSNPTGPTPGNREFATLLIESGKDDLRGVSDGQLVDRWNAPYWIASSGEVRSAGLDRVFYTLDDLVEGRNHPIEF